jgi:hypothetical protein
MFQKDITYDALYIIQTSEQYSRFKCGRISAANFRASGHPSSSRIDEMWKKCVKSYMTTDGLLLAIIRYKSTYINERFKHEAGCYKILPLPLNEVQIYDRLSVCK